jgi:hypothetical protein
MSRWTILRRVHVGVACVFVLGVAYFQLQRHEPFYNWDLIPYVGIAQVWSGKDLRDAHSATFTLLEQRVPPGRYADLIGRNDYRQGVFNNPDDLHKQFPFYTVKPAYPILLLVLDKLGMDMVSGSVGISMACYVSIGLLLLGWTCRYMPPFPAAVSVAALLSTPIVLHLAAFSTPDALSVFAMLLGVCLLVELRMEWAGWMLLVVAILIRPDNAILISVFAAWALMFGDPDRRKTVSVALLSSVGTYLLLKLLSGSYGWAIHLFHSLYGGMLDPTAQDVHFTMQQYLDIYGSLTRPDYAPYAWLFLALNILLLIRCAQKYGIRNIWSGLLASNLAYMVLHWIAHPVEKDRTLVLAYLLVFCSIFAGNNTPAAISRQAPATRA